MGQPATKATYVGRASVGAASVGAASVGAASVGAFIGDDEPTVVLRAIVDRTGFIEPTELGPTNGMQATPEVLALVRKFTTATAESENRIVAKNVAEIRTLRNSITDLSSTISNLNARIVALQHQLDLEREKSRNSSLISFWGGVAISIPIGVIINLVTG